MDAYSQYDITDSDPYLIPDSECLQNLLGLTDTTSLNEAERRTTQITMASLVANPVPPAFDLNHLKEIHRRLFQHIYPFAGCIRSVEIRKGGRLFLPYSLIKPEASKCFSTLAQENHLRGLSVTDFGIRAGFYLGRINTIYAFREGNGRTQRIMLDQLAALNGYSIQWAAISGQAMAEASREARTIDKSAHKLSRLVALNTVVDKW